MECKTIEDCVPYITHSDYNMRLIGEYQELKIRRKKLGNIIQRGKAKLLDFELNCPIKLLEIQYNHMCEYEEILAARIDIETDKSLAKRHK